MYVNIYASIKYRSYISIYVNAHEHTQTQKKSCYSKILLKMILSVIEVQMRSRCGEHDIISCESLLCHVWLLTSKDEEEVFSDAEYR